MNKLKELVIEGIVKKNIDLHDKAIRNKYQTKNELIHKFSQRLERIDSILDFEEYCAVIREMKESTQPPFVEEFYGNESSYYGHIDALYKYAGLNTSPDCKVIPKMEHGINPTIIEKPANEITEYSNFIFQSDYKKNQIHSVNPMKPVFVLGPYIHYADYIYDDEKLSEIKKENGKTLLIFPFHNFEFSYYNSDNKAFVDYVMNNYAKNYDTVLVSVYWNDIDDELYKLFEDKGAKLVSAGFRGDRNFINRLKTIINLADDVCGNGFGTHIGYSLYMKKNYFHIVTKRLFVDLNTKVTSSNENTDFEKQLIDLFKYENLIENNLGNEQILRFFEKYWGKLSDVKSKNDIKHMIELCNHITKKSRKNFMNFDKVVNQIKNDSIIQNSIKVVK